MQERKQAPDVNEREDRVHASQKDDIKVTSAVVTPLLFGRVEPLKVRFSEEHVVLAVRLPASKIMN